MSTVFDPIETQLACFSSRDSKEMLMQWNIDQTLKVQKFRFSGMFSANDPNEYDRILAEFFTRPDCMSIMSVSGSTTTPVTINKEMMHTSVMSMDFFDRLKESGIVLPSGNIRGCFEETFDGIPVGDKVREMLVNEDSENACLFGEDDRKQLIYALFKIFAVGGSMCQADTSIERYLNMTKSFYREILTIYKDSKSGDVKIAGRVYCIKEVAGLDLFTHPDNIHNALFVYVDPLKKQLVVVKKNFAPYW
jgi:cilia- and flagella-associated protein 300